MAGENEGARTFTEGEAYALVADAVTRETASANAQIETLTASNATLQGERDAMEVRATAAEAAQATAEQALVDYKAELESQKAAEAKRSTRLAEVAEVAPALKVEGERADRLVAMSDEVFGEYVTGLREVAAAAPHGFVPMASGADCKTCAKTKGEGLHAGFPAQKASEGIPRESAAFGGGSSSEGTGKTASVKGMFAARSSNAPAA